MIDTHKSYIIVRFYKETGHIVPLGIVEDLEIAKREVIYLRERYNTDDYEIQMFFTETFECASAARIYLDEKCRKFEKKYEEKDSSLA